jgi:type IV secretion system protein TrbE
MFLADFKTQAEGVPDLLMYASVIDDGVILLQDGAMMATWKYRGPDLASATFEEMSNISARLNKILLLGSDWMIHVDAIRSYSQDYPDSNFPDPITRMIDMERRQQFTLEGSHFESEYFLSLTYLPPMQKEEKLKGFLFEGETVKRNVATRALDYFKSKVSQFDDILTSLFQARRLGAVEEKDELGNTLRFNEQLRYVRRTLGGDDYKFAEPEIPIDLQEIIPTEGFWAGVAPRYGKKWIRIIAIDGFPAKSIPGVLAVLDAMPFEYRWSTRALTLDPEVAKSLLEKTHKKWRGKTRGFLDQLLNRPEGTGGTKDHFAVKMAADSEAAMSVASEAAVHFALYTSNIIIMHEDQARLDEMESEIKKAIFNAGFGCRSEDVNAVEAWRGSLPGDAYRNVRRVYLHTINLADSLPISAVWTGERVNPSALMPPNTPPLMITTSVGATPYRLHLHVSDVGHTLILGPTGAGKSTLLAMLAAQWRRYPGSKVYTFDKGKSMFVLAKAAGAEFYDMGAAGSGVQLCPLREIDDPADIAWAVDYVESLCALGGTTITAKHRNTINQAVRMLRSSPTRSLTELVTSIQDESLREALKHYTLDGAVGELLDAETDSLKSSRFMVFEMEALMNGGESGNKGLVAVLLYLFRQIEKQLDGSPTLILLDEAWVYLDHPLFRDKIRDWLKTMRRKNASVVLATQSISDVIKSPIRDVVLESCPTKILLPNAEAGNENSRPFYTQLGLNARENTIVQTAIPKRQYYITSPLGRRLIGLGIGGVAMSFVGVSSVEQRNAAIQLMAKYPDTWQSEWLRERAFTTNSPMLREWAGLLEAELELERSVSV